MYIHVTKCSIEHMRDKRQDGPYDTSKDTSGGRLSSNPLDALRTGSLVNVQHASVIVIIL